MNSKTVFSFLAAVVVVTVLPALGFAQQMGFQIGIAQPQFTFATPQAPAIAVNGPVIPAQTPIIQVPQGIAPVPLSPNFSNVIFPNPVIVPGIPPNGFPPAPVNPVNPFFGTIPTPVGTPSPVVVPPPLATRPFPSGTPRGDVLQQMGQPTTTIMTNQGETLFFPGGESVNLLNGQVVGPR